MFRGVVNSEGSKVHLLRFEVGEHRYALDSAAVHELVRAVSFQPLPQAPAIVEGVIDVRGVIVPVLDIRTRFRLPCKPLSHTDHLIVAWAGQRRVALRADRVVDLVRVDRERIVAATLIPEARRLMGVVSLADGLLLIHDLEQFLDAAEAEEIERAVSS